MSTSCNNIEKRITWSYTQFMRVLLQRVCEIFNIHVEMWWSHSLVQDLPLCYNRLDAWLIINHLGNTRWCKIHNVNIMLRTIFKHSGALLLLPVSMHFAFIYQLKMHLVWIWKYYAKLQCSCKQIMVLGDSVVLND